MLDSHTILSNLKCHTECSGVHLNYTSHRIPSHKIKSHTNPRENASKVAQYALVHPDRRTDGRTTDDRQTAMMMTIPSRPVRAEGKKSIWSNRINL